MTGSARRSHGWRVGRLAGVPVYLGASWVLVAVVLLVLFGPVVRRLVPELGAGSYAVAFAFALLLLFSVFVHEAAHALVGKACGYRVNRIVADFWGGHTAYDSADSTPGRSALVAVVGPLANAVLAGLGWLVTQTLEPGVPWLLAAGFTYANAFVAAFNLLPGLPLDGGFLVDSLVWKLSGSRGLGTLVAGWCGRLVVLVGLWWAVGIPVLRGQQIEMSRVLWLLLIGGFLWFGASDAIRVGKARRGMEGTLVRDVCRPAVLVAADIPVSALPPAHPNTDTVAVDATGTPVGIVDFGAVEQVPAGARGATPIDAVLRRQPAGWVVTADPDDPVTPVVIAMQTVGTPLVAVRDRAGRVLGLIHGRAD